MSAQNRRHASTTLTTTVAGTSAVAAAVNSPPKRLGVCVYSYTVRTFLPTRGQGATSGPLDFLEHCHALGAGGVQIGIASLKPDDLARFRDQRERFGMFFEGQTSLPRDEADVARFERDLRATKEAGASVVRTAMLGSRRYETFDSAPAFRQFAERSWKSLVLAEPVVRKLGLRLAMENHKDWRVPELLDLVRRISSAHVGICVDTGNSIALLEDPMAVVEAYAPWVFSTHIKDMGVQETDVGFLLSEVPLGDGFLDLRKMVDTLRRANPDVQFTLEMITRDPLVIPCLTRQYWATFETLPAKDLAQTLALVRTHAAQKPLPRVTGLSPADRLKAEDDNIRKCLAYAQAQLGI